MEAVIQIPIPTARDSETVVTALETAAVFRAKGDTAEALHWLQRAAESAGDDGDDERTLALARTAADLSRTLQQAALPAYVSSDQHTPTHSRRLPKPPQRASSAPLNHGPPPPPSSRPAPSQLGRAYSTPAAPAQAAQPRISAPPLLSSVPTRIEMRASDASALHDEQAEADADAQRLTQPVPAPSPSRFAELGHAPRLRQAARVSVVPSPDEPGLFLVRLLDDGSAPPVNAAEALMVLVDPNSTVFSE